LKHKRNHNLSNIKLYWTF